MSFLKYRTAAIYHACNTILQRLDNFQGHFLSELGISAGTALLVFNLAPLACRRDIAMLGVIHRCVLGKGPSHFQDFFKRASAKASITRRGARRHERDLIDIRNTDVLEIECRSILGLIWVCSHLPGTAAAANCVSSFQCNLQTLVKQRQLDGCHDWMVIISQLLQVHEHPLR